MGVQVLPLLADDLSFLQPEGEVVSPSMSMSEGRLIVEAYSVTAVLVNVEIKENSVALECGRECERILNLHRFILDRVPEERRWGLRRDL